MKKNGKFGLNCHRYIVLPLVLRIFRLSSSTILKNFSSKVVVGVKADCLTRDIDL